MNAFWEHIIRKIIQILIGFGKNGVVWITVFDCTSQINIEFSNENIVHQWMLVRG